MRKGTFEGREVDLQMTDFEVDKEVWATYTTKPDGVVLRVKLMVSEILRAQNEFTANGEPLFLFSHTIISSTSAPAHMQKDAQKPKKVQ